MNHAADKSQSSADVAPKEQQIEPTRTIEPHGVTSAVHVDPIIPRKPAATTPVEIGPYRIERVLGEGAMGKVYLATHRNLKRRVALKTMLPHTESSDVRVERFKREMEAVGRLDHPNIVRATDAGEENGLQFIAMEYIDGTDVQQLLDSVGTLTPAIACEIAQQAAEGLLHVQENGLVHRDLKPSNLIVAKSGQVKILDLGIVRIRSDNHVGTLTADGGLMGTPDFIAPEQILETGCVDIRADIYSLGCTLYRMLGGRAPFDGPDFGTSVAKVIAHTRTPPENLLVLAPDLPPALAEFIHHMMAKSPEDRVQTPQQVIEAMMCWADAEKLREAMQKTPASNAGPSCTPRQTNPPTPRRASVTQQVSSQPDRIKTSTAATLVLTLLVFTIFYFQPKLSRISASDTQEILTKQTSLQPAVPIRQPLEQIASATTALEGSAQSIDLTTQKMASTLDQIRDSIAAAASRGVTIDNPDSVGEIYYNAQTYTKQGKNEDARQAYQRLLSQDVPYVDVHKNFQRLLVAQEGIARARELYANVRIGDESVRELAQAFLLDRLAKREAIMEIVRLYPDFAPAVFELSQCVSANEAGTQTLAEQQQEQQLLTLFLKQHEDGQVLRYYLDKSAAARVVEEASARLTRLTSQLSSNDCPVTPTFIYSQDSMQVSLAISEKCTEVQYSIDGKRYEPSSNQLVQLPPRLSTETLWVKYTDASGVQRGPFPIAIDARGEELAATKQILQMRRYSWLQIKGQRIQYTPLLPYRKHIKNFAYGINSDRPTKLHEWPTNSGYFLEASEDVQFVTVQLTFSDDSVSEIIRIDR